MKSELATYADQVADYVVDDYASLKAKIDQCNAEGFEKHLAIQKVWRSGELIQRQMMIEQLKRTIYGKSEEENG